jgi:hypothetical protein
MGQSDETPNLGEKIQQLENAREQFISYLKGLHLPSRDQMIQKNYQQQIIQRTPWLIQSNILTQSINTRTLKEDETTLDWGTKINRMIDQIKNKPDKKEQILTLFLKQFVEIGDSDRQILLDVFKTLDITNLQKELLTLIQSFGKI